MPRQKGNVPPRRQFDDLSDLDQDMIIEKTKYLLKFIDISITVIDELGDNLDKLEESLKKFNWHAKAAAYETDKAVLLMTRWIYSLPRQREIVLAELQKRRARITNQLALAEARKSQQRSGQAKLDFLDRLMMQAKQQVHTDSNPTHIPSLR